jgi:cell division protein FtsA
MKMANLSVTNFVLDPYASAIAVLDEQQRNFGATVINIGATTTQYVCYKGSSLIYNGFLPVGSNHITNDLSVMLHTPPVAAEKIKTEYGNLLRSLEEIQNKKIRTPRIGDEKISSEVSLEHVQTIIHARVEEILTLIKSDLKKSGIYETLGTGLVLTGGMSKLEGIQELATLIFDNLPVKVSNPVNIKNGYMSFEDQKMSTIVGLLLYSLDPNRNFELDSNKALIKKRKIDDLSTVKIESQDLSGLDLSTPKPQVAKKNIKKEDPKLDDSGKLPTLNKKDKSKGVNKIWNAITEWF